jgi:hypothetical protein
MAYIGACLPKVAVHRVCVTTSLGPADSLHSEKACEEDAGYLASLTYDHSRW